jgi:hypothetical protein
MGLQEVTERKKAPAASIGTKMFVKARKAAFPGKKLKWDLWGIIATGNVMLSPSGLKPDGAESL